MIRLQILLLDWWHVIHLSNLKFCEIYLPSYPESRDPSVVIKVVCLLLYIMSQIRRTVTVIL